MKKLDDGTIVLFSVLGIIIVVLYFIVKGRNDLLKRDFTITQAKIVKVKLNANMGTISDQNLATFTYVYENKLYKKIIDIYNRKITKGECYELKIANKNPNIFKINFNKKMKCNE
ncbi:protein of unknown function [Tenacibaculum sp. 190130A14a]|uniref:DUF3592 domain-containing protein n=1 Tax=Tenacibaculum polynesiense TaxID=3137857 RepID=A0ABP1F492_9FLAO